MRNLRTAEARLQQYFSLLPVAMLQNMPAKDVITKL